MNDKLIQICGKGLPMSPDHAREIRDRLDKTRMKDLPGADEIGPARAMAAYRIFRPLLTARIDAPLISQT